MATTGTTSRTTTAPTRFEVGIAVLRVVVGVIFAAHGAQKLFVYGFAGVTAAFAKTGILLPGLTAPAVTLVEFLGGLALIVGVVTPLAAIGLALDMLGAILFVHLRKGFFAPSGFEYPFALLAALVAILLCGPGAYAVDRVRRRGEVRTPPPA